MNENDKPDKLDALAERKLGPGATVRVTREGWRAERACGDTAIKSVSGKTWNALATFLERMPDVES